MHTKNKDGRHAAHKGELNTTISSKRTVLIAKQINCKQTVQLQWQ